MVDVATDGYTVDAPVGAASDGMEALPWIIPDPDDKSASARRERFQILAEWTLIPRAERQRYNMPVTQTELAAMLGFSNGALSHWKSTPQFNRIMSARLRAHYGAERLAAVIDNLHDIALGGSPQAVSAAKTLIQYVQMAEDRPVDPQLDLEELSDEELAALKEATDRMTKERIGS